MTEIEELKIKIQEWENILKEVLKGYTGLLTKLDEQSKIIIQLYNKLAEGHNRCRLNTREDKECKGNSR